MTADRQEPDRAPDDLTPTLIANLRGGDRNAADLLDRLYRERLVCFCHGYLASRDEAEEVVQGVFCHVLEITAVPENFRAWIYKISRDRSLELLQSRGGDDRAPSSDSPLDARLTGRLTRGSGAEEWKRLRRVLEALPAPHREVLHLRYAEGLSRAEIAEVLDLDENKVRSRLYEAIEKLRLQDSLAEGP